MAVPLYTRLRFDRMFLLVEENDCKDVVFLKSRYRKNVF